MPSEPMTIAGLSESLPPAKISVSTATAHGGIIRMKLGEPCGLFFLMESSVTVSCKLFIKEAMTRLGFRLWCHEIRDSRTRSERNFDRLLRLFRCSLLPKDATFKGDLSFCHEDALH
jgi:hypothetical protein